MNKTRLLKVAEVLDDVPHSLFDMEFWGLQQPHCGMVCCAAGHAASRKWFMDRGFKLKHYARWIAGEQEEGFEVAFGKFKALKAVEKFFNISPADAEKLFGPRSRIKPEQVAKEIRRFVNK